MKLLIEADYEIIRDQVKRDQKSENILEFLDIKMFSFSLYDDYVKYAHDHPHLDIEQVV